MSLGWPETEVYATCQEANPAVTSCWGPTATFQYNKDLDRHQQRLYTGVCGFKYEERDLSFLLPRVIWQNKTLSEWGILPSRKNFDSLLLSKQLLVTLTYEISN